MRVTISRRQSFLICEESGDILAGTEQGFYSYDTRFLSSYETFLNGVKPGVLTGRGIGFATAIHYLTNPRLDGVKPETIIVSRERFVSEGLYEDLKLYNYGDRELPVSLKLVIRNDFADIFEVKAIHRVRRVKPQYDYDSKNIYIWHSAQDFYRETRVSISQPFEYSDEAVIFKLKLAPKSTWQCNLAFLALSQKLPRRPISLKKEAPAVKPLALKEARLEEVEGTAGFKSDFTTLEKAFNQSKLDLAALRLVNFAGEGDILAAGIPWYTTAFGRDSLITSYQALPVWPELAKGTLKVLAKFQGAEVDNFTEEQPGRIIHEIRFGRLATTKIVPHAHYYGTIDATPLFIMLAEQYYRWTQDKKLIELLKENIYRALKWMDEFGDLDKDGFVEYLRMNPKGIYNQGWKDSGDAISFSDGRLAEAPIALAEVQGYVYSAKRRGAKLLKLYGDMDEAKTLEKQAAQLKKQFNEAFWMPDKGYFAIALDKHKKQVDSITSNGIQILWTRIADVKKAEQAAQRAMEPDLFSGWGIRTLSKEEKRYNPISYHNGSVWPHDNSIIMVGFLKHALEEQAVRLFNALISASLHFYNNRLPELFCGFDKSETTVPISYPTSSNPQAWAAGAIPYMTSSLLRVQPDIDNNRMTIAPFLLPRMNKAFFEGIRIGDARVSIKVDRVDSTFLISTLDKPDWLKIEKL